jgi:glycerol-3-phosphate acyltransferase PlsY
VFANFKGGKGIATILGLAIALNWKIATICILFFVLIVWISRFISVGSMITAIIGAVLSFYFYQNNIIANAFFCSIAVMVLYTHRSNIIRLKNGNENRFSFKK